MIAADNSNLIAVVVGFVLTAGGGTIAFFFRQWANDLGDKVDHLADKVDDLDDKLDGAVNDISQLKIAVGWPPSQVRIGRGR